MHRETAARRTPDFPGTLLRAGWAPVVVFVFHALAGRAFGHEPTVDPISHFLGGCAIVHFVRQAGSAATRWLGSPSSLGLDLLAFGLATVAAVAWELGELAVDVLFGTTIQTDAHNVLRDLALGAGGALVYLGLRRLIPGSDSGHRSA